MKIPFIGLVPKRKLVQDLGFRILETDIFANGKGGFKGRYIDEVRAILHEEFKAVKEHILSLQFGSSSGSGSSFTSSEEEEKKKGKEAVKFLTDSSRKRMWRSVNPNQDVIIDLGKDEEEKRKKLKELIPSYLRVVIWGQSEWSQHFADLSTLTLVSHHDGGGPLPDWNRGLNNVIHRFLSSDQISQWVIPDGRNLGKNAVYSSNVLRAKVVPHGLPRTAYGMCPDKGYFLWVASLDWGWKEKGLDIFLKMAEKRPQYKFIAYGTGKTEMAQRFMSELTILSKTLTNFLFRGELKRDKHFAAFCGATAFVMPTHASIGESFGMTVIESLSKGVPVIASTNGAVPEVLGIGGDIIKLKSSGMLDASRAVLSGTSRFGVTCDGEDYDCYLKATDTFWNRSETSSKEIMIHAWNRFDGLFVVDSLLNYTIEGLSLVASH
jgi:glycosyltransferase involved in cell wall biosynthesis